MGAPCVCGVEALKIDAEKKQAVVAGTDIVIQEGDMISLDGTTGIVVLGAVDAGASRAHRRPGHHPGVGRRVPHAWVCAPTPTTPRTRSCPATSAPQGIGLCRTEHMFLGDRKQIIQTFILNDDEDVRQKAVEQLFEAQTGDFYGMFKAMDGLPVIVRLLDPPLHEFLESPRALDVEIARLEATGGDKGDHRREARPHGADRRHGRGQPHAGSARLPPGHRVPHPPCDAGARHRNRRRPARRRRAWTPSPRS